MNTIERNIPESGLPTNMEDSSTGSGEEPSKTSLIVRASLGHKQPGNMNMDMQKTAMQVTGYIQMCVRTRTAIYQDLHPRYLRTRRYAFMN